MSLDIVSFWLGMVSVAVVFGVWLVVQFIAFRHPIFWHGKLATDKRKQLLLDELIRIEKDEKGE